MTKADFLRLLGQAYDFPDYYGHNLDAADEILSDMCESSATDRLSLLPFFDTLLADVPKEERAAILRLLDKHFSLGQGGKGEE